MKRVLCKGPRVEYASIKEHRHQHRIAVLCRVLKIYGKGIYAWIKEPESACVTEARRLRDMTDARHEACNYAYGSPRLLQNLREWCATSGLHRVARIIRQHRSRGAYANRTSRYANDRFAVRAPDPLQREFKLK